MNWFYAEAGKQLGPVSKEEFDSMVQSGRIGPSTLVWHDGMKDWQPMRTLSVESSDSLNPKIRCSECFKEVAEDEALMYRDVWVCASCKNAFFQKVREGQNVSGRFEYAGFWPRAGAKLIDAVILWIAEMVVLIPLWVVSFRQVFSGGEPGPAMPFLSLFLYPVIFGLSIGYNVYFLGKYNATPGKMVLGLKVITSDGGSITYTKGLVRALAEMLSGLICYIGYLMVAFDAEEHKALHDMICDTRVVRK
jgi:uncharacterized RDD family membrane protein YckC